MQREAEWNAQWEAKWAVLRRALYVFFKGQLLIVQREILKLFMLEWLAKAH